jgi:hypothetical protein
MKRFANIELMLYILVRIEIPPIWNQVGKIYILPTQHKLQSQEK